MSKSSNVDDRNLAEDGINDPHYWYSVSDGFRLVLWLRQKYLDYNNIPSKAREEYTYFRENNNHILITDPYHSDNFSNYLNDDINRITASENFAASNAWTQMPTTIIIPLLSGLHWRTIKIDINYDSKQVSILFDDPYGKGAFPESLKSTILNDIKLPIEKLINKDSGDTTFTLTKDKMHTTEKLIDQQGHGQNSWDCGPITFSNIEDYTKATVNASMIHYTIPAHDLPEHNEEMILTRVDDIFKYSEVSGIPIDQSKLNDIKGYLVEKQKQERQELEKLSFELTSGLSDLEISKLFVVLANMRLFEGDNYDEQYSKQELEYARNVVLSERKSENNASETSSASVDSDSEKESSNPSLDLLKFCKIIEMAHGLQQFAQMLFNPPASGIPQSQEINANSLGPILEMLSGHGKQSSLFARAQEFINESFKDFHPYLKSSEINTILVIMIRTAMQLRPEYFSSLKPGEPVSSKLTYEIFTKFIKEFVEEGALDKWVSLFQQTITNKSSKDSSSEAALKFIDIIAQGIRYISSGAVNDPLQYPLNKDIDPNIITEAISLKEWLHNHQEHPDYDQIQSQFSKLDKQIESSQFMAMQKYSNGSFSLLKGLKPELSDLNDAPALHDYFKTKAKTDKRAEFEKFVSNHTTEKDIFEPSLLRTFWETTYRKQYGSVCYEMVCESFEEEHKDSLVHQMVQHIWAVSQLDTIHEQPKEAKSRMPSESIDGLYAPNFGYKMSESESYKKWITNPLVRASGDIIVDAFHFAVNFGRELDIDEFVSLLNTHLTNTSHDISYYSHKYQSFIIPFERHLLEKIYGVEFIPGMNKTITNELIKASKEKSQIIIETAKEVLNSFKNFSIEMLKLRPSVADKEAPKGYKDGLVFGIGFNGKLFDSPNHSYIDKDEIWITFSQAGRKVGGNLLLEFIKKFATMRYEGVSSLSNSINNEVFEKYKSLIKWHVKVLIENACYVPDSKHDSHSLQYHQSKRIEYKNFMSQLESDIPFHELNNGLQEWIQKASNWYSVPGNIKIAEDMPREEHGAQKFARELLFDALTKRSFLAEHTDLVPLLFLHWKKEVLAKLKLSDAELQTILSVGTVEAFIGLGQDLRETIGNELDKFIWDVHEKIKIVWEEKISDSFFSFKKNNNCKVPNIKSLEKLTQTLPNQIDRKKNEIEKGELKSRLESVKQELSKLKLMNVIDPTQLPLEIYQDFKKFFFEKSDVSQCIEPPFARVLGHDRFFPIFISKKVGQTNILDQDGTTPLKLGTKIPQDIIAPCDSRCQHHVLGHVYTGDMLSHQSADQLDQMRRVHNSEGVPDRFWTFLSNNQNEESSDELPEEIPTQIISSTDNLSTMGDESLLSSSCED